MKALLLAAYVLSVTSGFSENLVVLGKNEICAIHSTGEISALPAEGHKLAFLRAYESRGDHLSFDGSLPFATPPAWGKTVPSSGGDLHYAKSFPGGFAAHIHLSGLAPHHIYLLTLNGNPERKGNNLLLDAVPNVPNEKFYDFLRIETNEHGAYDCDVGVLLPAGDYDVRIYVKDTDDFKIVLYRDFFEFAVTSYPARPSANK